MNSTVHLVTITMEKMGNDDDYSTAEIVGKFKRKNSFASDLRRLAGSANEPGMLIPTAPSKTSCDNPASKP